MKAVRSLIEGTVRLIDANMIESEEVSLAAIAMYENRVTRDRDRIYDHAGDARKIVSTLSDLAAPGVKNVFKRVKETLAVHSMDPSDDWEHLRKTFHDAFDEMDSFEIRTGNLERVHRSLDVVRRNLHLACITVISGVLCASKCLIVKENKRLREQRR